VDRHDLGDCVKREAVSSHSASLLHYPDMTFDFGYVLVGTVQVDHGSTWHSFDQGLERCKFTVSMHHRDVEATLQVVLVHFLESLEYLRNSPVREVIDSCKTYFSTKCQEKRNLVHEEDISCQKNLFVEFQQLLWNFHIVPGHRVHLAPSGLPFQCGNVIPPNLRCNIDVLNHHGEVFDSIAPNYPLEILHGRVAQGLVQVSCDLCTLDLPLGKACLVFQDSVNEGHMMFLPQVIIM
jgi:hypothetical protein